MMIRGDFMTIQEKQQFTVNFPVLKYFQQLFASDSYVKFINPFRFWRRYRINHLEACWSINLVQYLERCHQLEWSPVQLQENPDFMNNLSQIPIYLGLPWEKTSQNTLLITQTPFELKYRDVTYLTDEITNS